MEKVTIKISELVIDGEIANIIINCLKKHEPEIWNVLRNELMLGIKNEQSK